MAYKSTGTAGKSSSGASMSKYDVEVEARLQALEKAVAEIKSGGAQGDASKVEKLVQNEPYRYIKMPNPLENGQPDYRIQKWNNYNGYKDMYLCDNSMQLTTAIEDFEYTKWLDPEGVPCYVKDRVEC